MSENTNTGVKIRYLNPDEFIKEHGLKEVTSDRMYDINTQELHVDGLFSEDIFGHIGSAERYTQYGYINFKVKCLQPIVFITILQLRDLYGRIINGRSYAIFNEETKDFDPAKEDDENAGTGYTFFMKHYPYLKFKETPSLARQDKINNLRKYADSVMTNKMIIIPAGQRDIEFRDSNITYDEINKLYQKLIYYARAIPHEDELSDIYDNVKLNIQKLIVEIFNYLYNMYSGKTGYGQSKYTSRAVVNGTRNVITAPHIENRSPDDPQAFKTDECLIGLYQVVKMYQPVVISRLRHLFLGNVFNDSNRVPAINKKTFNIEYVNVDFDEIDKFNTIDGLISMSSKLQYDTNWWEPVTIKAADGQDYYLMLIYDDGDSICTVRNKEEFCDIYEETFGKRPNDKFFKPITFCEMFYFATFFAIRNLPCTITRYPVLNTNGIIPCKVHLCTTNPGRAVQLVTPLFEERFTIPEWPVRGAKTYMGMAPHPATLAPLGADFDGDAVNAIGIMSNDAAEEVRLYLDSLKSIIDPTGSLIFDVSTDIANMVAYSMTK